MYNSRSQPATRNCCVVQFTVLIGFMLPITRLFLLRNLTLESYLLKMTKSQLPINQITPQSIISKVTNNENERLWKTVKLARTSFQKLQLQWGFFNLLRWRLFVYPRLLLYFMCYLYTLLMFGGAIFIFFSILGLQPRDKAAMLGPTWPPWRHVQTSNLVTALTVWILINFVTQLL